MGDNSTQEVVGKGKIKMKLTMGENTIFTTLNDAIYVPGLAKNLFSMNEVTFQG
jgi:hypothetical protein